MDSLSQKPQHIGKDPHSQNVPYISQFTHTTQSLMGLHCTKTNTVTTRSLCLSGKRKLETKIPLKRKTQSSDTWPKSNRSINDTLIYIYMKTLQTALYVNWILESEEKWRPSLCCSVCMEKKRS